jgi:hypothetical protein
MRRSWKPLVGMVILALVVGLSVTVSAQDDDEALTVTHVTGKQSSMSMTSEPEEWEDGDVLYRRGVRTERTVEWSDPRLPSRFLADTNANWHVFGDGAVGGFANAVRLVGEEGDWAGTEYSLLDPESAVGLYVLAGEGVYDGLWAMLVGSLVVDADGNLVIDADNQATSVYEGYVFESALPPMPDPIEPPLSPPAVAHVDEPAPVTLVTGTVVEQFEHPGPGDREEGPPDSVNGWMVSAEKYGVLEQVIDWSDPRLPARHWMNLDLTFVLKPSEEQGRAPEGALAVTTSNLLEGPEGSWRGTGRAIGDADDRYGMYELTGEGAYEGLWAVLRTTPGMDTSGPWDHSYEGYIFEADPMAFPEPPESVATTGIQMFPESGE